MVNRDSEELAVTTPISKEYIQAGGDIVIDEVYITTNYGEVDVRNFIVQVELYEDIFANVMMGEALMSDAAGLISRLPITGGEMFTITARTPTLPNDEVNAIKRSFVIYAVSERILLKDRQQLYKLKFISPEGLADNQARISRTYRGTTDSIVEKVFTEYLQGTRYIRDGQFSSTKTPLALINAPNKTSLTVVSPNWSPLKLINWVANRSQSSTGQANNFLFFESNKQFYFGSIEDIVSGQRNSNLLMSEYFYSDASIRDPGASNFSFSVPDIDRSYKLIQAINVPKMFDILQGQDFGYYSGTLATYDILLKKYKEHAWDYQANWDKYNHAEDYSTTGGKIVNKNGFSHPFSPNVLRHPNTFRAFRTKHYMMFEDYPDNKVETWAMQRNSMIYGLSDIKVEINVAGRTDAEVGRLVYVHFPIGSDKTNKVEENFDPYMSGVYIITAIRHLISLQGKHRMSLELVKDSFRKHLIQ